jgi:hypothetical protein
MGYFVSMRKVYLSLVIGALYFGIQSNAYAGCSDKSLSGNWFGSITVVNIEPATYNYTAYCEVSITSKSGMSMIGSCNSISSDGSPTDGKSDELVSQNLQIDKDCAITGTLNSKMGGSTAVHGHLSTSKNVFVASFKNTTGGIGSMQFVK